MRRESDREKVKRDDESARGREVDAKNFKHHSKEFVSVCALNDELMRRSTASSAAVMMLVVG